MMSTQRDSAPNAQYVKYVVSPDLAKRMHQCGYTTPSMWFWVVNDMLESTMLYRGDTDYLGDLRYRFWAPTAAEIRAVMPQELWVTLKTKSIIRRAAHIHYLQQQGKHTASLVIRSADTAQLYELYREEDTNEAEAVGRLWCYVYENGLNELKP